MRSSWRAFIDAAEKVTLESARADKQPDLDVVNLADWQLRRRIDRLMIDVDMKRSVFQMEYLQEIMKQTGESARRTYALSTAVVVLSIVTVVATIAQSSNAQSQTFLQSRSIELQARSVELQERALKLQEEAAKRK